LEQGSHSQTALRLIFDFQRMTECFVQDIIPTQVLLQGPDLPVIFSPAQVNGPPLRTRKTGFCRLIDIPTDYSKNTEIGRHIIQEAWD
jgi:hypothetical protein